MPESPCYFVTERDVDGRCEVCGHRHKTGEDLPLEASEYLAAGYYMSPHEFVGRPLRHCGRYHRESHALPSELLRLIGDHAHVVRPDSD